MYRDFEENDENSKINDFNRDEFYPESMNLIQFQSLRQDSAPSKNGGIKNRNWSEISLNRRRDIEGLKRVKMEGDNEQKFDIESHQAKVEDQQAKNEWEQMKILEITEALNLDSQDGLYSRGSDDPWLCRGDEGEAQETEDVICVNRKVHIGMRSIQDLSGEEDHVVSRKIGMQQRNGSNRRWTRIEIKNLEG